MKLLNIFQGKKSGVRSSFQKGFTLTEILVVIGIFGLLAGLGIFMSMDAFRSYSHRSERDIIVSVLEKARSRGMNNLYKSAHKVCFDSTANTYVIFRGTNYTSAASKEAIPAKSLVTLAGFPLCNSGSAIVFAQLTGKTASTTITISEPGRPDSVISINNEGTINW